MEKFIAGSPTQIEKVLYRLLDVVTLVVFLIDGSGSVSAEGFRTMVNIARSIANRINLQNCRIGALQYSTRVTVLCAPTTNLQQFHQTLDSIVQDRQGNEEAVALDAVVRLSRECPGNGKRLIIHLTDGGLMGPWKAAATNVKYTEKMGIMSIGVGRNIDAHNIREFASPGLAFFVKDYEELQKTFQFLDLAPLPKPVLKPVHDSKVDARTIHLELETYPLASDVKRYHVEMLNPETLEWNLVASSLSTSIVVKNVRPNTTCTLRVYVELHSGRESVPSADITVTTLPQNPHFAVAHNLVEAVAQRLNECQEFVLSPSAQKLRITRFVALVTGFPGAGKSSLLTAVLSMLVGRYLPCGASGATNVTLTRVVTEISELKKLLMIDTPGLTDENIKIFEKHLYFGGIPGGFDERKPDFSLLKTADQVPIHKQVHCVIIAVSCETLVEAPLMATLKEQYKNVLGQGRNCLVLLTQVDKVDPRIKLSEPESLVLVYESGLVMNIRKSLAAHLGINIDCVLPVVSYSAPMKPVPWVSMLHLDWIEKALEMSDGFCSTLFSIERSKRAKNDHLSMDDLMEQILEEEESLGKTTAVPKTTVSATPSVTNVPINPDAKFEILVRREEDPATEWKSIYLRNSDRSMSALSIWVAARYARPPSAIVKLAERRQIDGTTFYKTLESDQDVHHLVDSAMKGNMVFIVVSFDGAK